MAQNLVEKIAGRYAFGLKEGQVVRSGDYLFIQPAHIMTHDNTGAVMMKFKEIDAGKIADPRQPVFTLDHNIQDTSEKNLEKYRNIEAFAKEMGVDFYPAGRGIGHQVMCEEGYAFPGTMVVASDSHSNMYGGLGCLGTPVVRTDAAALWATGITWWQIPPVARVKLTGKLQQGVVGKDIIITLCGMFNKDEVLNHAVEFTGGGIGELNTDQRLSIANMTTEWGALVGLFPIDTVTVEWLRRRAGRIRERGLAGVPSDADGNGEHPRLNETSIGSIEEEKLSADPGAFYAKELSLDLSTVRPHVSGPDHVKVMTSVSDIEKENIGIQKAYLVSCVNSRVEDIAEAASVVRGKKIADNVDFYVAAASSEVEEESKKRGDWQALLDAGAQALPPGCGPCIGLGVGLLEDGEVGISATNRNFKGRMGSRNARAYLASPAVVAASALAGKIAGPKKYDSADIVWSVRENEPDTGEKSETTLLDGMPAVLMGELLFCHQDNLNTDGIYPGKYTYVDDITPEQQAGVVMENYDPQFNEIAEKGDILVGGFNFGSGSSREQAATALKYRGIQLVVAGSSSQTFKRNALNNGFLVVEAPELVQELKNRFGTGRLTVRTSIDAKIDLKKSVITADGKDYSIDPVGTTAQELVLTGGMESWIKKQLSV
ncbi:homoaconitase [candidate division KSB1 bacterium]